MDVAAKLEESNRLAQLPTGEIIATIRRNSQALEMMNERFDELLAEKIGLEQMLRASDELARDQAATIATLKAQLRAAQVRGMRLVVNNQETAGEVSCLLRPQAG